MRFLFAFLISLLFTCPVQSIYAQDSETTWPPEAPETLFGPHVEIVDFKLDSTIIRQAHPATVADDYRAVVTANGRIYPWPDLLENRVSAYPLPNGTISNQFFLASGRHEMEWLWKLDLSTGVYTRFKRIPEYVDTFCGRLRLDSSLLNDWMIVTGVHQQRHLCNVSTGQMSTPLPDDYADWQIHRSVEKAPYVLFSGRRVDHTDSTATLFAFNLASLDVQTIDEFQRGDETRVTAVLNEKMQKLSTSDTSSSNPSKTIFLVKISEQRLFQIPDEGIYRENPLRLEYYVPLNNEQSCEVTIIDLLTEKRTMYTLNTACYHETAHETRYYYRVLNEGRTEATIIRVNALTGENISLFSGEVEYIGWMSADERYAAFFMDYNGHIDTPPGQLFRASGSADAQLVLFDLSTGNRLFETPASVSTGMTEEWLPFPHLVNANELVVGDSLLQFEDDTVVVTAAERGKGRDVGDGWVIEFPDETLNEYGNVASHGLYNINMQEEVALVDLGDHVSDYWIYEVPEYLGDNKFQVTLSFRGGYQFDGVPPLNNLAIYTVRITNINLEQAE